MITLYHHWLAQCIMLKSARSLAALALNEYSAPVLRSMSVCKFIFQVIGAATQCALSTSQLVACAKVVAPTISDPLCQEQLMEAAKEVAKSVEGCVTTCKAVGRDEKSLHELRSSAQDVTR